MVPSFFLSPPGLLSLAGVIALVATSRLDSGRLSGSVSSASVTLTMRVTISLVVLAASLYVIIARPEATDDHKWAYSVIGVIVGYWLRRRG